MASGSSLRMRLRVAYNSGVAMSDSVPQLLTLHAVARALCVSPHTVRAWVKKGKLQPLRICARLLFHPDEVARFLAESK